MKSARRAVVTGLGIVSPIGNDVDTFTEGVLSGRSGIFEIEAFDPSPFRSPFGGQVRDFNSSEHLTKEEMDLFDDPYLPYAIKAARDALESAKLSWSREKPPTPRAAIVVGTCNGGLKTAEEQYRIVLGQKQGHFDRRMNTLIRYHSFGKALSYCLGVSGPTWVVTTACSSSTAALGLSFELITQGVVDTVLAGGSDALCLATLAGFNALKATSTSKTAPFSMPQGLNLGEGAGFWVVEAEETAAARGAEISGEIRGYAFTADAHHPTAPDPRGDGAYRTMMTALERGSVSVSKLGCISAHGTGTEANDRTETKAIKRLIGDHPVPVHSFKSQVGHCLGAAGILEATAALVAMQKGYLPATMNFAEPRPGCSLDYVPNVPRKADYDAFLSCNYAFGGNNAGVVVGKYDAHRTMTADPGTNLRTLITGGGTLTSLGIGTETLVKGLKSQKRGLFSNSERVQGPVISNLAGLIGDFQARDIDRRLDFKGMNRISRFATAAARLALKDAGLRVGPKEGIATGIVNGVYTGPDEEGQMRAVISTGGAEADIGSFSQIVANAVAGWVSSALMLRGYTTTISQGADSGLFAMLIAHLAIKSRSTTRVLAGASDELFSRYIRNYDELGLLYQGEEEDYRLRLDVNSRRVLGEGAAYLVAEESSSAMERGASIQGELVGYGMTTDWASFYEPNTNPDGLARAIGEAIVGAGWTEQDVGLISWSPQGNKNDLKILEAVKRALPKRGDVIPLVTSVFNTGLCESVSGTSTLAAILYCLKEGIELWPQMTGVQDLDSRPLPTGPVPILVLASSDLGYNLALAIEPKLSDLA